MHEHVFKSQRDSNNTAKIKVLTHYGQLESEHGGYPKREAEPFFDYRQPCIARSDVRRNTMPYLLLPLVLPVPLSTYINETDATCRGLNFIQFFCAYYAIRSRNPVIATIRFFVKICAAGHA